MKTSIQKLLLILLLIITSVYTAFAQEFIIPTNGPEGIEARSMAIHPNGSIFVSALDGSYYESTDQGNSWVWKSRRNYGCEAMIVTSWGDIFVGESSRILKSSDLAVTWEEVYNLPTQNTILSLLFNTNTGDVIAGTYYAGIFVSDDSGATWQSKNSGLTSYAGMRINSLYQHTNGDIYATATNYSGAGFIYRSKDNAESWAVLGDALADKYYEDITLTSDNRIFVVTRNGSIFRSDDGGTTWQNFNSGISEPAFRSIIALPGIPSDVLLVGTTNGGVYRSVNFGFTWTHLNNHGIYGLITWDIKYNNASGVSYLSIQNAGIFRSDTEGLYWTAQNKGLAHTNVQDVIINENNTLFAGVWWAGVYRSYDGGENWKWVSADFAIPSVLSLTSKPGYIFAGTTGDGVYVSTDEGDSWAQIGLADAGWITAMVVGPSGEIYAGNTGGEIYQTTNNGSEWNLLPYNVGDEVLDMVLNPHTNSIFVAIDDISTGGIHRSTDGGATWTKYTELSSTRVHSLAVSPVENIMYASTADNGIYVSMDNGDSWSEPANNNLSKWIDAVAVNSLGEIFAGGNNIYRSRDGGENFEVVSEEPSSTNAAAFVFDASEVLYIGTAEESVWRSVTPTTARNVHFSVKMKFQDGFMPDTSEVVVQGPFNNWGDNGEFVLTAENDVDLTYSGTLVMTEPNDGILDGNFKYEYIAAGRGESRGIREIPWAGKEDLFLDPVWFDDQEEFSKIYMGEIVKESTDSRGVAWGDFDNDGWEDLIITDSGTSSRNDLFRNNGDGSFSKITAGPVTSDVGESTAACWGDFNNDGWLDLYIANLNNQNNFLYRNNGDGTFSKVEGGNETAQGGNSVGAVWADFDNDGWLDLFVANQGSQSNYLFHNDSGVTFTPITSGDVVTDVGDSKGCAAADYNNKNGIDLFVANGGVTGENNFLYANNGDGSFTKITDGPVASDARVSSGGSWGDFNNDGWLDLYVTNRNGSNNVLYKNNMGENFLAVGSADLPADSSDSRGSAWVDYDNDGWLDLFVSNAGDEKNVLFRSSGMGFFERISFGPIVTDLRTDSRGVAWGDYNNDGSPDLFVANNAGKNALYRNNISQKKWLKIKLEGTVSNKTAIGATVVVKTKLSSEDGSIFEQRRSIDGQSGFLGQNSQILMFGLRSEANVDSIIIYWPSGTIDRLSNFETNQVLTFKEPEPGVPPPTPVLNLPQDGATDIALSPTLAWNQAGDAYMYHLQVSDNMMFSTLITQDSTITNVTYSVSGLVNDQTYYWRVRAKNDAGWGSWSAPWSFTTGAGGSVPGAPSLASPADGASDIALPPTVMWNSTGDAFRYWVQISELVTFGTLMANDSSLTSTSFTAGAGRYNTNYHWRVKAKNSVGWGPWSATWNFMTEPLVGQPDPPTLTSPTNGQDKMPIPALLQWSSIALGEFAVQVAEDNLFTNVIYNEIVTDRHVYVLSGLTHNATYYWRVNVSVNSNVSDWSAVWSFSTYAPDVSADRSISFPTFDRRDQFAPEDYLLIGLPGNADLYFRDVLGEGVKENWMAYWDNGKSGKPEEYYVAYDGTDIFKFKTGNAFWIIHNGTININRQIPKAPLNSLAQAEIDIHAGYNIITCPFGFSVDWAQIKEVNDIVSSAPLWRYNRSSQSFIERSELETFEGFYFFNNNGTRGKLLIPYYNTSLQKPAVKSELIWEGRIEVSSGKSVDASTRFGTSMQASAGLDKFDYRKPRAFGNAATAYFERPEWDRNYSIFASDIRPEVDGMELWDFKVAAPKQNSVILSLTGLSNIPEEFEVYLIDKTRQRFQNLRENEIYDFVSTPEISEFEIMIGNSLEIEEKLKTIVPKELALGQNYPNPFNPSTTIPFTLPEQNDVTLKIFNLLGQEVTTVFKGTLDAGRYYFLWNGTSNRKDIVPSGIYIYQMTTSSGKSFAGKMVFLM